MSDGTHRAVFVGIGIGSYDDPRYGELPQAPSQVREIAALLEEAGCELHVTTADPTEDEARDHLREALRPDSLEPGTCLVVLWAGHGDLGGQPGTYLVARDTRPAVASILRASDLGEYAARSGARQILIVLDTCYSGDGTLPAVEVASNVLGSLASSEQPIWVGVLASTLPLQQARDGLFGDRLAKLLREGPSDPLLRRRWSPHDTHVRLDDVADALAQEWDHHAQTPRFLRDGVSRPVLPNPLFDTTARPAIVEHLLLAARGAEPGDETSFFTGRVQPLNEVVAWLAEERPGVFVITGPAGSGKSAIVGRIVSLSDPRERARILAGGPLEHADPGAGSVHAHVHARGITADRLVEEIDRHLVGAGVLAEVDASPRDRGALARALADADVVPVVAIDGLDEAGAEAVALTEDVVRLLRPHVRFLIGTRDTPEPGLVEAAAPDHLLDLGDERYSDQTAEDAIAYVRKRLLGFDDDTMDAVAVGRVLVGSAKQSGEGVFLLARIVTAQLRAAPIDTAAEGWQAQLATAVGEALARDLARIPPLARAAEILLPEAARELLTALAWSYGAGMPDEVWAVAATALSETGTTYDRDDILWLLAHAGRYVVEDGEDGRAVYRLVHQHLADLLLPSRRIDHVETPAAELAEALIRHYERLHDAGLDLREPRYLWLYAWRHCADGGRRGVDALRTIVERAPRLFRPVLAGALQSLSYRLSDVGRFIEAVGPAEEAVSLYRDIVDDDPSRIHALALTLGKLGSHYGDVGRHEEALASVLESVEILEELTTDNPSFGDDLSHALNSLGIRYAKLERYEAALDATQRAIDRHLARPGEGSGETSDLAMALGNLSAHLIGLHRHEEALKASEQAAEIFEELAHDDPAYQSDLATAYNNLGACYYLTNRREEGIGSLTRALDIYRELAKDNGVFASDVAMTLNNVGSAYGDIGRHGEGLRCAEESVRIYEPLALANPAFVPNYATALNNLGVRYCALDRHDKALPAFEEAIRLRRALARDNGAFIRSLADSLRNLEVTLHRLGRTGEIDAAWMDAADEFSDAEQHSALLGLRAVTVRLQAP